MQLGESRTEEITLSIFLWDGGKLLAEDAIRIWEQCDSVLGAMKQLRVTFHASSFGYEAEPESDYKALWVSRPLVLRTLKYQGEYSRSNLESDPLFVVRPSPNANTAHFDKTFCKGYGDG
ncbi:hypothetical protein EDD18DRAFT_1103558 [Armillaria luteobubalina]|uniref:Uncharacterized protein n=1 Tax=Armillaria luteobubalina TaxID=153913 RepID=A0AA39QA87_9AGAR|nr:hypothetical protein EDD18DRAFT_1103558 [Armillaria luteobubalina]